jgi:hypothetical protein
MNELKSRGKFAIDLREQSGQTRVEASIRSRSSTFNGCNYNLSMLSHDFEQNAPIAYPATKPGKALQFTNVALKRILLHVGQRR